MVTYILVHGADQSEHLWDGVAPLLREKGHEVFCPTLESIKQSTLQKDIDTVSALIEKNKLNNIVLVGHSYASMVITGVLDKYDDKIQCLVYIDSVIPKNGQALRDFFTAQGFDYEKDFNLTLDEPVVTPLYFDEEKLNKKSKIYIHCLQSEFLPLAKPIYTQMRQQKDNTWRSFELDAKHNCMKSHARELASILLEASCG